jgi:hypothetical protein
MQEQKVASLCTCTHHANGIHEYVLADSSRQAYDDFLVYLEMMFHDSPPDEYLHSLVDFSNGLPPLQYAFRRTAELLKRYQGRTNDSRVAYLYKPGAVISLVQSFISLFRLNRAAGRFFTADQRDEAITWLLEE